MDGVGTDQAAREGSVVGEAAPRPIPPTTMAETQTAPTAAPAAPPAPSPDPSGQASEASSGAQKTSALPQSTFGTVAVDAPKVYWDADQGKYWHRNADGKWSCLNETATRRVLLSRGLLKGDSNQQGTIDAELLRIQMEQGVEYAGRLAGWKAGCYELQQWRILITSSPNPVKPVAGAWPLFRALVDGWFVESAEYRKAKGLPEDAALVDQRAIFFSWMHLALRALHQGQLDPGQAMVFAGDPDCGKSLLQSLITYIMGGRSAKPYPYMTGQTNFNGGLFGAEHLVIGDEVAQIDMKSRRTFAAKLKQVVAETTQRMEGKFREEQVLSPFWRITISLNMEPENLLVLPPIDVDIADKIILLRVYSRPFPEIAARRQEFWAALTAEMPAFVHWVMHEWSVPEVMRGRRFGVVHYHHPELVGVLNALTGQHRLLELIDSCMWDTGRTVPGVGLYHGRTCWRGTAIELESLLKDKDSPVRDQARELIQTGNVLGTYLGKLSHRYPDRVVQQRTAAKRAWIIYEPPAAATMTPNDAEAIGF
jgi:hypothetical protein